MKIRELLNIWNLESGEQLENSEHRVRLTLYDAAKLAALADLFPGRTEQQLLSELVSAALDELQASFPYKQSGRVQAVDEQGDPIYADEGLGPNFHELSLKHLNRMQAAAGQVSPESTTGLQQSQNKSDRQSVERAENEGMTSLIEPSKIKQ